MRQLLGRVPDAMSTRPSFRAHLAYTPVSGRLGAEWIAMTTSRQILRITRIYRFRVGISPDSIDSILIPGWRRITVLVLNPVKSVDTHHLATTYQALSADQEATTGCCNRGVERVSRLFDRSDASPERRVTIDRPVAIVQTPHRGHIAGIRPDIQGDIAPLLWCL